MHMYHLHELLTQPNASKGYEALVYLSVESAYPRHVLIATSIKDKCIKMDKQ